MVFKEQEKKYEASNDIWNTNWKDKDAIGSVLEGRIEAVGEQKFTDKNGKERVRKVFTIKDKNGKIKKTPAHAELIAGLHDAKQGDLVRLTYIGIVISPTSETAVPGYKVEIDR